MPPSADHVIWVQWKAGDSVNEKTQNKFKNIFFNIISKGICQDEIGLRVMLIKENT